MNITSEDILRLINHLSGDETQQEQSEIIKELAENPTLFEEFEKLKKLQIAFKASEISKKIKSIHQHLLDNECELNE